jgi:hypothetical protein
MNDKQFNLPSNVSKTFTSGESADGEFSEFSMLWEGVIQPTRIESYEENGKPTQLVIKAQKPIQGNVLIIKK